MTHTTREQSAAGPGTGPGRRRMGAALLARLVLNLAAPVLVYLLVRPHVHSDLTALVIGAAIPVAYTVAVFAWRRRVDATGAIAVLCFGLGLLVVIATGGSELAFKLREDIWTGPLGLACLISVAVRRPLLLLLMRRLARRNPLVAERLRSPGGERRVAVVTAAIGLILLVHAVVMVVLAVSTSTTEYLAVGKPIGWAIVGGGVAALAVWVGRSRMRSGGA